jgi:hypothetical protein
MRRSFASKSMFTSAMVGYETKSIINPVNGFGYGGGGGVGSGVSITNAELESLYSIQTLYTSKLANNDYANIPVNYLQYLKLREVASNASLKYKSNSALSLLFQITVDGITGAINSYGLNTLNTETQVQNLYLQNKLQEIISGVNVTKAFDKTFGSISIKQTFKLAPIFQYYISIHGVPAPGAGFDPVKLALILTAMENSGIDPYSS